MAGPESDLTGFMSSNAAAAEVNQIVTEAILPRTDTNGWRGVISYIWYPAYRCTTSWAFQVSRL